MSDQIPAEPRPEGATPVPGRRIAFERLRERTDELELLISGLLAFALLTVPSRLFDAWARNDVHVEGALAQGLQFAFTIGVGSAIRWAWPSSCIWRSAATGSAWSA